MREGVSLLESSFSTILAILSPFLSCKARDEKYTAAAAFFRYVLLS